MGRLDVGSPSALGKLQAVTSSQACGEAGCRALLQPWESFKQWPLLQHVWKMECRALLQPWESFKQWPLLQHVGRLDVELSFSSGRASSSDLFSTMGGGWNVELSFNPGKASSSDLFSSCRRNDRLSCSFELFQSVAVFYTKIKQQKNNSNFCPLNSYFPMRLRPYFWARQMAQVQRLPIVHCYQGPEGLPSPCKNSSLWFSLCTSTFIREVWKS